MSLFVILCIFMFSDRDYYPIENISLNIAEYDYLSVSIYYKLINIILKAWKKKKYMHNLWRVSSKGKRGKRKQILSVKFHRK